MERTPLLTLWTPATVTGLLLTADAYSLPMYAESEAHTRLTLVAPVTGTPVGVIRLQSSDFPERVLRDVERATYGTANETAKWQTLLLPAGCVHGLDGVSATFTGPSTDINWSGAVALNAWVSLLYGGAALRVFWDYTSGGSSSSRLAVYGRARQA